jgi:MATE family multidrug resistance protein
VVGFGWNVRGVAGATVLAEYVALAAGLWVVWRKLGAGAFAGWDRRSVFARTRMLALLRVNGDIFIRTVCLIFAFAYFTAAGAKMGDVVLAANAVLLHFQSIMAYGLDGFAHAAEMLVGSAVGARDRRALRQAVIAATWLAVVVAVAVMAIYAVGGAHLVDLFTVSPEVRSAAYGYLPWLIASPILSVWSFMLDGIFIGATRTAEMRNGMVISLAVYLAAALALVPLLGNHGLWLALMLFLVARAATLGLWYSRIPRAISATRAAAAAEPLTPPLSRKGRGS